MSSLPHLASRGALSSEGGGWSESVIEDLGETLGTGGIEEGFERHHIALIVGQRDTPVRILVIGAGLVLRTLLPHRIGNR